MTLAAEAPDLDVIGGMVRGSAFGFAHHRGFTHSFLGRSSARRVARSSASCICSGASAAAGVNDSKVPPRWGLLFLYACLAGLSHILLDFTNNYGVRPFLALF